MNENECIRSIDEILRSSELLARVRALRTFPRWPVVCRGTPVALSHAQIERLERNGCTATDWKTVRAVGEIDASRVVRVHFDGQVLLGSFAGTVSLAGTDLPCGVFDSTVSHCEISGEAHVAAVGLLSHMVVFPGAVVRSCGTVAVTGETSFGNGALLSLGIETGGRDVLSFAEMTIGHAALAAARRGEAAFLSAWEERAKKYAAGAVSTVGAVGAGARVMNTPNVRNVLVGDGAVIDGASHVENVSILSSPDEPVRILSGAFVRSSLVQWGCEIASLAIVDESVLTEHSHVERHGKVTQSIVGPNTGVAEGEVTASLLGPFVGFHHQALLIAAMWPEGKGNVAYGSNIGSNHTSRAPDQELWPGEGAFFGLGASVKYPSDFRKAPYSIFAMGVVTLPQRLEFPFSLVNEPEASIPGVSPAYNQVKPGWVLSDNLYMVRRNEGKYKKRNKAMRSRFDFDVLRPDTIHMMVEARSRLQDASGKEIYTSNDVEGLGKNYMTESDRRKGIETYTFHIGYYALLGLKERLTALLASGSNDAVGGLRKSGDAAWDHRRRILEAEFGGIDPEAQLARLIDAQRKVATAVEESKRKDDVRGARIIEDYGEAHGAAERDAFVRETWRETERLEAEVADILRQIKGT
jgi:hypothetical protein